MDLGSACCGRGHRLNSGDVLGPACRGSRWWKVPTKIKTFAPIKVPSRSRRTSAVPNCDRVFVVAKPPFCGEVVRCWRWRDCFFYVISLKPLNLLVLSFVSGWWSNSGRKRRTRLKQFQTRFYSVKIRSGSLTDGNVESGETWEHVGLWKMDAGV